MEEKQSHTSERSPSTNDQDATRLGFIYDIPGVDQEYVPLFAKVLRTLGFFAASLFVLWGLFSEWEYGDSPFESMAAWMGFRYRNQGAAAYGMAGIIWTFGWLFRFHIGASISALLFGLLSAIKRIFRAL